MRQGRIIKKINYNLDEIIDKSKSLKKIEGLKKEYWFMEGFDDKELKLKIFKLKRADMSNETETKFGHTLIKLVDKLINTKNKK